MELEIRELLQAPSWRAFDIDDQGRILAGHDGFGTVQLVELSPNGEATALTALLGACRGRYLGGRRVVVEHDRGGDELQQLSLLALRAALAEPVGEAALVPLVRDPRHFHNLVDRAEDRIVYTTNRRNGVDFDVMWRDVESGAEGVVYEGGGAVVEAALSRDGSRAVVARSTNQPMSEQLLLVELGGGAPQPLTGPDLAAQHHRVAWLPDGRSLLVTTDRNREFTALCRLDTKTGAWRELVADPRHDVTGWPSPDGRWLLVMTNDDGWARLALHECASGALVRQLHLPDLGWTGEPATPDPIFSPNSRWAALSCTGPTTPGDVLRIELATGSVTTVAGSRPALGGQRLAEPRALLVPALDGERIPCLIYRPEATAVGSEPGSAVVHIHGGPEAQAVRSFNPVIQGLVAAGHTVVAPNVRGSTGYGRRWYSGDDRRLRPHAIADLAAVHRGLPELGVDPRRAALWGGSYGGYMVLAGLAFQPELWAAGVDIVGISSLVTFLEHTSPYRRSQREPEYGYLDRDREFLESISPLTRSHDIRAPLFIIHGANDPRVPLGEAEQLVAALGSQGVPCELLVYHDEGHGLVKRINRLDAYPRAFAFLAQHLGGSGRLSAAAGEGDVDRGDYDPDHTVQSDLGCAGRVGDDAG